MARFYKKDLFGMVKAEGGMSDPEVSEVRMAIKEYRELLGRVQSAEKTASRAKDEAKDRIERIKEEAREAIEDFERQAEANAAKKVAAAQVAAMRSEQEAVNLKKQLEEAREIVRNEKYLNENLTRIMRERANQARGIKPKKQHDGYLVMECRQWTERYSEEVWDTEDHMMRYGGNPRIARKKGYLRTEQKTVAVWKSILQTPYDASLPLEQIKYRVEEDLWNSGILKDIGCQGMAESSANGQNTYLEQDVGRPENSLYKWAYKANYRTGFWELELYTTKSLQVPKNRRPPQKIKERKRRQKQEVSEVHGKIADDEFDLLFDGLD